MGSRSCFFLTFLQSSWSSRGNRDDAVTPGEGGPPSPSYFHRYSPSPLTLFSSLVPSLSRAQGCGRDAFGANFPGRRGPAGWRVGAGGAGVNSGHSMPGSSAEHLGAGGGAPAPIPLGMGVLREGIAGSRL